MTQRRRHEFNFVIEGIDLTPQHREEICRAIHAAGMSKIAGLDLAGDHVAEEIPARHQAADGNGGGGGGGGGGAQLRFRPAQP